ncbi:hypothetical protein [Curtobacterium sp. MCBD17_030]|uniref:hypothetical protein n=1 Tax=Curtobacterium sp. MCBD17_030 TaxID=2175649 RepID=UPI000D84805D|nr:hypothetical protein [Curtobacterium sp. MCBD17_030]PYY38722.1 hypothetical protein DEI89_02685 [Curtobacterium sp. MCBD17_030]
MEPWEQIDLCWRAPEPADDFAEWLADRSTVTHDHLVGVAEIGRDETGALVARASAPVGLALPAALDRIGSPTAGVAVTLTLPLLELALLADAGAVLLGRAGIDDVLVDDAGAVVLVDRPPGTTDRSGPGVVSGVEALVLAVRAVWERVDPREVCHDEVDQACSAARRDGGAALLALDRVIRAAAPPRPVRWDPPPMTFAFDVDPRVPGPAAPHSAVGRLLQSGRGLLRSGLPVGSHRFGVRRLATGLVVVVGVVVAGAWGAR